MDPWGTSKHYVIFQLEGQVAKSSVKWATKDPTWNEDFALNIKLTKTPNLQVAVWDANLVTSPKRMGNGWVNPHSLCDALLIVIFGFSTREKPFKTLPGNMGWPIIGETPSFLKPYLANSMGDFMEDHISRYGKVFSSKLLGRKAIVSADAGLNRFVQNKDEKQFKHAWFSTARGIFGRESIAFASGEAHHKLRSIIVDFLSMRRLQTVFLEDANHLASAIVKSWKDKDLISAKHESIKYSMQMMARSTLSIMTEDDPRMKMLQSDYSHILSALFSLPISFPGTKYWKALRVRRNVIKIVKKTMGERIKSKVKDEERDRDDDLLDLLLKSNEHSNELIEDLIMGVIFAGHDSTSRAMAFMLYLLANSPTVIKKLQEEHLQIAKSKVDIEHKVNWDDYKKMEFTQCVINESLRLSSVAPFIPKKAIEDVQYKDILIPKGCFVVVHMRSVHLDPMVYENPLQFNPWRWLEESNEKRKWSFMPFGGGARSCLGANLAKLEMAVFLHHIIINYEWEMEKSTDQPIFLPYLEYPKGLPLKIKALRFE